jgi:hypothetical protein
MIYKLSLGVVTNVQGYSHLSQRVRGVRKLVEPTRIRLDSWNVGSLTGKLRELVDAASRRRVSIICVQETKWKGQKRRRWRTLVSNYGTQEQWQTKME